jgi:hypothetical protein
VFLIGRSFSVAQLARKESNPAVSTSASRRNIFD